MYENCLLIIWCFIQEIINKVSFVSRHKQKAESVNDSDSMAVKAQTFGKSAKRTLDSCL